MEESDIELIRRLLPANVELKKLMDEHELFEGQLAEMSRRSSLSAEEQVEKKRVQKLKLAGKDRIEQILSKHRTG